MRLAIEGCGHGTLHAIYASVDGACRIKGWKGVDLLIIGGDFQAVRNQYDLNVTAMPQKFRQMADFHEYYSGTRTAPYLTIFIGGNHEASNHLFELYYGGWVAPNIYYLGAANVLRFGPLRIAGLSGIWKGYDYRKPHFERLPYNEEEMTSIFHVRELDVRKLLSLRSQVDIGLSHDWPQGIEWQGDHKWLFDRKKGFKADAVSGKLGSVAAKQCLDRLRPPFWFSAHLHTKYTAIANHDMHKNPPSSDGTDVKQLPQHNGNHIKSKNEPHNTNNGNKKENMGSHDRKQISAWQNFHAEARQQDIEENKKLQQEIALRKAEEERTGVRTGPQYVFEETFRKVDADDNLNRNVVLSTSDTISTGKEQTSIPDLDGCGYSRPSKRARELSDSDNGQVDMSSTLQPNSDVRSSQVDGGLVSTAVLPDKSLDNPDAIDIDMSDDENESVSPVTALESKPASTHAAAAHTDVGMQDSTKYESDASEDGGARVTISAFDKGGTGTNVPITRVENETSPVQNFPEKDNLHPTSDMGSGNANINPENYDASVKSSIGTSLKDGLATALQQKPDTAVEADNEVQNDISEDMRAELAALSGKFTNQAKVNASPALPFPEAITSKTTKFLALGKCEMFQEFLQLLEIDSITSSNQENQQPPKLHYDKEWLAILRVFAPELALGGNPTDPTPTHRGETYYRDRIIEEENWIEEHVVKPGLMQIPENFTATAPVYDPSLAIGPKEMPREVTNPQTVEFCKLIGIENPFDISEEERDARMERGPKLESYSFQNRPRGGQRRGGGGGGDRGRGGRGGGFGGGRARGRGRGRY